MLRIILKTVYHNEDLQIHDEVFKTLDIENEGLRTLLETHDFRESLKALSQKRDPSFKGK